MRLAHQKDPRTDRPPLLGAAVRDNAGIKDRTSPKPGRRRWLLVPRAACLISLGLAVPGPSHAETQTVKGSAIMDTRDLYPLITTPALFKARDFYVTHFGFEVAFQAAWFVYLSGAPDGDSRGATLAFMHPDHPSRPPGPESFDGKGMILTVEVADAASAFQRLSASDVPIVHDLTDEAWGQRRFMVRDPAGILIDVVEQIAPQAGYWDQYLIE